MFLPAANRLARFFEMSALSINLAQSGGSQYKAGFLKIESCASKGAGFGRKSTGWRQKKESRWCAVRESYLVVLEEPGEVCPLSITRSCNLPAPTAYRVGRVSA
jgi:phospholipase D1/2